MTSSNRHIKLYDAAENQYTIPLYDISGNKYSWVDDINNYAKNIYTYTFNDNECILQRQHGGTWISYIKAPEDVINVMKIKNKTLPIPEHIKSKIKAENCDIDINPDCLTNKQRPLQYEKEGYITLNFCYIGDCNPEIHEASFNYIKNAHYWTHEEVKELTEELTKLILSAK